MRAGRLNKRVTIKQVTQAKNAYHEMIDTWTTLATVWAEVSPLNGREVFEAQKVNAASTIKVTMRARSDITSAMQLVYSGVTYAIDYVPPYDSRRDMEIIAHVVT